MQRDIVVIGASAGGIAAISELLQSLPADLPASLFVVLHISPVTHSQLPEIWNRRSELRVLHPRNGERIQPGHVYVAPPDRHMLCQDGVIEVSRGPTENRHRPAVDPLFRSAAHGFGPRVIGVVLTGLLDDGTAGLRDIKRRGGVAIVQNPNDAEYAGMPLSAIRSVDVDYVVSLEKMGRVIASLCRGEAVTRSNVTDFGSGEALP